MAAVDEFQQKIAQLELPELLTTEDTRRFFEKIMPELSAMGLCGLLFPVGYGGSGLKVEGYVTVLEALASRSVVAAYVINEHSTVGSLPLQLFGTPEQKELYLPVMARGRLAAFALTEPSGGSDPSQMQTIAEPCECGFVLNGKKVHISLVGYATLYTIFAKMGQGGITAFLVESKAEGLSYGTGWASLA